MRSPLSSRLSGGDEAVWSIDRFLPADREALAEQWEELPRESFTFAECDGETVTVAPTLAMFLACCREAAQK